MERMLGAGATSVVFEARHRNGRRVAIKALRPELAARANAVRRFLREAYLANRIEHPGTVSVYDDGRSDDGTVFLVLEYLSGETAAAAAKRLGGRMPPAEVLRIAEGVLQVMRAAHARRIVHHDIKPANIFLTADGVVKLLDFGLAHAQKHVRKTSFWRRRLRGTPRFMAPEQARGELQTGPGADVWGLGATMFTLLTGASPRTGTTTSEILLAALTEPIPPIRTVLPDLPPACADVVDRALRVNEQERWTDAGAMALAVQRARDSLGGDPAYLIQMGTEIERRASVSRDYTLPDCRETVFSTEANGNDRNTESEGTQDGSVSGERRSGDHFSSFSSDPPSLSTLVDESGPAVRGGFGFFRNIGAALVQWPPPPRRVAKVLLGVFLIVAAIGHNWGHKSDGETDKQALAPLSTNCAHARPPARPKQAIERSSVEFVVAIHTSDVGLLDTDTGQPGYSVLGYDLDGHCTGQGQGTSCVEPTWATVDHTDGLEGRDNAAGHLLYELQRQGVDLQGSSVSKDAALSEPLYLPTVLLRVRDYNGELDDPQVHVTYYVGIRAPTPDGSSGSGLRGSDPQGTNVWNIDALELRPSSQGEFDLDHSRFDDPSAYVSGGVLVSHLPAAPLFTPRQEPARSLDYWLTARVMQSPAGTWELRDGIQAGRLPLTELLSSVPGYDDPTDPMRGPLCMGSFAYSGLKAQICAHADISSRDGPSLPCDALSVGSAFSAVPATLGAVVIREPLPRRCPPSTDPIHDHCP